MLRLLIVVLLPVFVESTYAARLPDTVEKQFIIEGEKAAIVAEFLGFLSKEDGIYHLPWAPNTSECYKRADEKGSIFERCDPTRLENTIKFYAGEKPKLVLSGYWLDAETGSVENVPKYFFMSPKFNNGGNSAAWKFIANKFSNSLTTHNSSKEVLTDSSPLVTVTVYVSGETVQYKLGIDDRLPEQREEARKKFLDCMEIRKKNPMEGGGC